MLDPSRGPINGPAGGRGMGSGTLFAQDFLLTGIRETDDWRGLDDREVDATAAAMRACLADAVPSMREANTETLVIFPIFDALGWGERRLVQGQLDTIRRLHVPDAVYFASPEARRAAQAKPPADSARSMSACYDMSGSPRSTSGQSFTQLPPLCISSTRARTLPSCIEIEPMNAGVRF
jgi:hypothetical protein